MHRFLPLALLSCALPVFAWGPEGHILVARIAEAQLTPAVHAKVVEILGAGKTMASVSSWADEGRRARPESAPWHYVDIPIDKPHLDMERDCPKGACIVSELAVLQQTLRDSSASPEKRREALMFVIHFLGDLHQPLHCADRDDRGGNSVPVEYDGRRMNLHSAWDSGLLGHMGTEEQLFPALLEESRKHHKKWSKGTVSDWADEGHKIAKDVVYAKLPAAAAGTPVTLDAAYEQTADPQIRHQLEVAGARLAKVLNTALR